MITLSFNYLNGMYRHNGVIKLGGGAMDCVISLNYLADTMCLVTV